MIHWELNRALSLNFALLFSNCWLILRTCAHSDRGGVGFTYCFELLENVMSLPPNLVRHLGKIMLQWSPLWLATTAVTTALGFAYVTFVKEEVWVASQAMIVRDEIGGTMNRQGRFDNKEALKAALDTILEVARNPQVVQQALLTQLPPDSPPLSEKDINNFIGGQLAVRSPKGSEFGTTEIFYVDVRHNDQQQAIELNKAICTSLEKRLQDIRMSRYDGIERELEYALEIAKEQRAIATEQLKKIESDVGDNLTDLRSLTDSPSAGGTAKMIVDQLTSERRQVEVQNRQLQEDLRFLQNLEDDPARVLVAPSNVLNSQPGLKRLCEGLVDSQIQELQLTGRYTDEHPAVRAAKFSRQAIRQQLSTELQLARNTLETEINVSEQRVKLLDDQIKAAQKRISELADIRADYANILGEVRNRSTIIEQIEKDLAVAESNRRAAGQSSLVTRIDAPVLSDKPVGPGTKTILLAAMMAGLLSGIGLILLIAPIDLGIKHGRRWSDHIYAANQAMNRNSDTSSVASPNPQQTNPQQPDTQPVSPAAPSFATAAAVTSAQNPFANALESTLAQAQAVAKTVKSVTAAATQAINSKIEPITRRATSIPASTATNIATNTATNTSTNTASSAPVNTPAQPTVKPTTDSVPNITPVSATALKQENLVQKKADTQPIATKPPTSKPPTQKLPAQNSPVKNSPAENLPAQKSSVPNSPAQKSPPPKPPVPKSAVNAAPISTANSTTTNSTTTTNTTTTNSSTNTTTASARSSELLSYPISPATRPSELASAIQPPAALVRAVQVANQVGGPIKLESPNKISDTTPVASPSAKPAASPSKPRNSDEPASDSSSASERRTRPRQPPAAIFAEAIEGKVFGFSEPSKIAT